MNKAVSISLTVVAVVGVAFGCARLLLPPSNWHQYELQSDNTLKTEPQHLQKAEDQLMMAIETAFKDRVPEKEIVHVYEKMGDLMMAEGKYEDSQKYFLRTIQFNNALHIEADQNISQLGKLEAAYEKSRDYENAEQTQGVLVKFIEMEKSPSDPAYEPAKAKHAELKVKLAQFNSPEDLPKVKVAEHVTTPAEQKQQETLLTGWH
jgi:hypothetical protein